MSIGWMQANCGATCRQHKRGTLVSASRADMMKVLAAFRFSMMIFK
jgi:hypothetical protein